MQIKNSHLRAKLDHWGTTELDLVGSAMETSPHIAVVDDHHDIRDLVGQYLTRHGYKVSLAESGQALRELLEREAIDLIVLDIMMPGEDGISVCRQLRTSATTPIIFLTAMSEDTDRIVGLEIGADDYLVKPFNPRELLARVRAVLRRTQGAAVRPNEPVKGTTVRFDQWTLDFARQELTGKDGIGVALSTVEFRLLKAFLDHPGMILSRDQLLDLTAGRMADSFDRSIDNQVSRLRKKVEADPKNPSIIKTHWGGGYSLSASVVKS